MGNDAFGESYGRSPREWEARRFLLPHKCTLCSNWFWGKGFFGCVYWVMDVDRYYSHRECLTERALAR